MILPILLGVAVVGIYGLSQGGVVGSSGGRIYNLPDVSPADQSGSFSDDFDQIFETVADESGVPYALMKAHCVQESGFDPNALRQEPATSSRPASASYGLMQVLWWPGSNRFALYGFPDSSLQPYSMSEAGALLYDPYTNIKIASRIIKDNLNSCHGNIRDAINMYNTGVKESVRQAPGNYTDKVYSYYQTILGKA